MKRSIALIPLLAIGLVNAGQPLHEVLKLRTVEVLRCEAVTQDNVAEVSSFIRAASSSGEVQPDRTGAADGVPGFLVEGIVIRQRDVAFPRMGSSEPIKDTFWVGVDGSAALGFFVPGEHPETCEAFATGTRVNVVLSQRAECDTYPPTGLCLFDYPIRPVDPETWVKYGG